MTRIFMALTIALLTALNLDAGILLKADSVYSFPTQQGARRLTVSASAQKNKGGKGLGKAWWGIGWTDVNGTPHRLRIGWGNTDYGEITDTRYLKLELVKGDSILDSQMYTSGVNLHKGSNFLALLIDDAGNAEWSIGSDGLAGTGQYTNLMAPVPDSFHVFTHGTDLNLHATSSASVNSAENIPTTPYPSIKDFPANAEAAASPDGVWIYLDRENDPKWALPGGRYTLGVRRGEDPDTWLIVYLDGATTNAHSWRPGMIKGKLFDTPFTRHYHLEWVDAEFVPIDLTGECSASLSDDGAILTLSFPLDHATLRFYRP